jgi:tRNA1(Val) A37 N6-methylase TrmN6
MSGITEGTLLNGRVRYRQFATGHRSGFEPVLLAATVPARPGERVLEAGTGAGAALLCLAARVPGVAGVGVEIDPALAGLANENFSINGLSGISAMVDDIRKLNAGEKFDHAMANPPWHDASGTASPDAKRALAHQAGDELLADWVGAMAAALQPRGSLTLIIPAATLARAAAALLGAGCRGIGIFPLWPRAGQPAGQIIITGRKGSKSPDRLLSGLILHDESGITVAAQAVLRDGAALAV